MQSHQKIIFIARQTIETESRAIAYLANLVDDEFAQAVEYVFNSGGRVIITGIGKSANIATKIVATLNSTGTPSAFMHAADAIHGDLGTIQPEDSVICISKSGNTPEIKVLVPLIKSLGNKLFLLVELGALKAVRGEIYLYIMKILNTSINLFQLKRNVYKEQAQDYIQHLVSVEGKYFDYENSFHCTWNFVDSI